MKDRKSTAEYMLNRDNGNGVRLSFTGGITIKKDIPGMELTDFGISFQNGKIIIPWILIDGYCIIETKCIVCGAPIKYTRHNEENYNMCVPCGKESDDLLEE
jgi:hypothetical protein